jgi:hypothetical protein
MMENCSVETVKKIFRAYLDRYGSRLSDNPVLTNILNFTSTQTDDMGLGKQVWFTKIAEEILSKKARRVRTDLMCIVEFPPEEGEEISDYHCIMTVESTVSDLEAKAMRFSDFRNLSFRDATDADFAQFRMAAAYEQLFPDCNHVLRMQDDVYIQTFMATLPGR